MNITIWREENGYTREDLSKEIDIPLDELRKWEMDFGSCPVQRLVEMALEGIEAKQAFETVGGMIDSIKVDDSVMDRFHEHMKHRKEIGFD